MDSSLESKDIIKVDFNNQESTCLVCGQLCTDPNPIRNAVAIREHVVFNHPERLKELQIQSRRERKFRGF